MSKPVVVIGAGLAGLSAASYLQAANRSVILLDASDRAGGRVQSDLIDGFTCDRGFQLINAKYPELIALSTLNNNFLAKLDFRSAEPSINIVIDGKSHKLGDPRKHPGSIFDSATGSIFEKAGLLKALLIKPKGNISIEEHLNNSGSGKTYLRVFKPFLRGVFLTDLSNISAVDGLEILKSFVSGKPGLPVSGAGAISTAIAENISDLRLKTTVHAIEPGLVISDNGKIEASEIVIATDSTTAAQLLELTSVPKLAGCTTWYHSSNEPPVAHGELIVDGKSAGCVINTLVISNFIREYSPNGKSLISTTTDIGATESDVRRHLAALYGCDNRDWQLVAKYEIPAALPLGPKKASQPIETYVRDGIYLAGDAQVASSQNGALKSGRLAANAILAKSLN